HTELYTLSLHDALPISSSLGNETADGRGRAVASVDSAQRVRGAESREINRRRPGRRGLRGRDSGARSVLSRGTTARPSRPPGDRSEEHTSELQSRFDLV